MSHTSTNRVVLIGRLTRDPELRSLASGHSVCALRVACNSLRKDAAGEYQERPNYFDVSVFGAHGETVHRYLRKGSRLAVDGRLDWREWETAEGQRRQAVSVVADSVEFLGSPGDPQGEEESGDDDGAPDAGELVGVGVGAGESDLVF
ncbi:MAG TPA: single-stranded DNA-binding protein [Solirubrobacteraceae bacterium]|jgi:single-strand DNA-binding protein